LRAVLFQAGLAFLAADADAVVPHVGTDSRVYLPAGDGAFAATIVGARTTDGQQHFIYARAGTWLSAAMLKPDQIPLPRAASAERTVALALWLPESHSPVAIPALPKLTPEGEAAPTVKGVPSLPSEPTCLQQTEGEHRQVNPHGTLYPVRGDARNHSSPKYESALRALELSDRYDPITEIIARRIIEAAQTGLRDPDSLCATAIKDLRVQLGLGTNYRFIPLTSHEGRK
jgi:hypothetical protein